MGNDSPSNFEGSADREPLVIGTEMAAARAAEASHRAEERGLSPLAGVNYESLLGELNLLRPVASPQDDLVHRQLDQFVGSDAGDRDEIRSTLTMDDFYTVLTFARRSAVMALRDDAPDVARHGILALAVIDQERIDWRDLSWVAGVLAYAVQRTGGDSAEAFTTAAALASPDVSASLASFALEPPADLADWGYREVETDAGLGLVQDDGAPFEPAADLIAVGEAIAASIGRDVWHLGEPVTGSDLPGVWFRETPAAEVDAATSSLSGCVLVRGELAPEQSPDASSQHMLVFVAETATPEAAQLLAAAAGPGSGSSFAAIGVADRRLCAVLVARSFVQGIASFETQASLERFRSALRAGLAGSEAV